MTVSIKDIEILFDKLWPVCRSITGEGFRKSLDILSKLIPTQRLKFETGQKVFDWEIPEEWVINDAFIIDPNGRKFADFKENNLHLMGYSTSYNGYLNLKELKKHIYTLPDKPNAIPYVTSYYERRWGFCMKYEDYKNLIEGDYKVLIDSYFVNGHVEVGEALLTGTTDREILFSTYLCHPSMANHELSGPILIGLLYDYLSKIRNLQYTYRFVICPETIGSIALLSLRGEHFREKLDAGYVITCVGDSGPLTYKSSRRGNAYCDRVAKVVLNHVKNSSIVAFTPFGSDERQYCSPGFNLPVGSLMRTMYGKFNEYHTSLDNKSFINFESIVDTFDHYRMMVEVIENNCKLISKNPYCEPQLGKRNLYSTISGIQIIDINSKALIWILNLSDGQNDLIDISEKSGIHVIEIIKAAKVAICEGLVERVQSNE
jgi:aminopeptidase-like protein